MKTSTRATLTQSQMMIWMGQKLNPTAPLYNMILTFEISGKVDVDCFQKAFQKLVDNTDVLRSVVRSSNDVPFQEFYSAYESPLTFVDLSNKTDAYHEYKGWVEEHKGKLFDIEKTLYETVLFKISDEKYVWYLNQHHLITDGGAIKFVYEEMNKYYQQMVDVNLAATNVQNSFESYAIENSFEQEAEVLAYWRNKLDAAPANISLYGVKSKAKTSHSTRVNIDLGLERTQALKALTNDDDLKAWTPELALSNIFLTIISALLFKIGNQEKFAIGLPSQNRGSKKEKRTAGLFMQLLPLDIRVDATDTLLSICNKVKNESLEVMKNAIVSRPPSALLKTFNVVLNYIPVTLSDFAGMPVASDWLLSGHVDAHHYIRLQIQDFSNTGNYKLQFDLNNELFSIDQRQYITEHFIKIVDAFILNKNTKLSELQLITDGEIKKIEALNNTKVVFDETEILLSKFEAQVLKTPKATALVFGDDTYSYKTLNEKANQVAHFLIYEGVQSNDIVAISFERSLEMIVYIYGILKAGAAYLPIDTSMPSQRLNFIATDAAFKILLFNHDQIEQNTLSEVNCYHIADIEHKVSSMNTNDPDIKIATDNLSYIIYTSGSTGEPKGVKCHHKGICNRLNWMNAAYPITTNDVLLQKTPITFDVSVWELFWPLQVGAKLIIEKPNGHKDPDQLVKTIIANNVSVIHFVPSMLDVFISTSDVTDCLSLKYLFCSGESLPLQTVRETYAKLPDITIHNLYGPTEASIDVTHWHCKKDYLKEGIAIGYPVANTQIFIVDEQFNLVPMGMKGELCIGGVQVASGYLNRKDLTRQKFIHNPFSDDVDAKLYKTGDIARYRADGAIEYIGRNDNQVKLRGIRIELGEIENVIKQNFDVSQVVVLVTNIETLFAYYTGNSINEYEISSVLSQVVPEYMIPTHFENIKEFPLTKNGKIDKVALKGLSPTIAPHNKLFVAPDGDIEELIASIWKEVLQLEKVSTQDNFIALGGHSLAAIRVTARISEEIEMKFPLNKIFEQPTIASYSKYIEETLISLLDE